MAAPDFKFYRDWLIHALGEMSQFVTGVEIAATLADINREILAEIGLRETIKTGEITYALTDQYATLPTDALEVQEVTIVEDDETKYIDVISFRNIAERKHRLAIKSGYAYSVGRILHFSWDVEADTTVTVYYLPFLEDALIEVGADTVDLGSQNTLVPILLGKALRYGALSDLMNVHGRTEMHEAKARRWDGIYRNAVTRAKKNVRELLPPRSIREIRNY